MNIDYLSSNLFVFSGKNYKELSEKENTKTKNTMQKYRKKMEEIVGLLYSNDDYLLSTFYLSMYSLIDKEYKESWYEGMALAGLQIEEISDNEKLAMIQAINEAQSYIEKLGNDIIEEKNSKDGSINKLEKRLNMWANGLLKVKNLALLYSSSDPKLMFVEGDTKEKCDDCISLNGKVKRASIWMKMSKYPQSPSLACKGINCGCRFVPTELSLTR